MYRLKSVIAVLLAVLVLTACGGGGSNGGSGAAPDTTAPTVTVLPTSGSAVRETTQIQLLFSESMDVKTVVVGGTLAAEADSGVWSKTKSTDDTLTFTPLTTWSSGSGKTLTLDATDLAGNPLSHQTISYDVDNTAPTANAVPASMSTIGKNDQIVISFSESMKPDSLVLGGTMGSESGSGVWSSTAQTNDTLTLGPSTSWAGGSGRTLTVNATDLAGNPMAELALSYSVDATLASGIVSPVNGSALATDQTVTIVFSKAMDSATLSLAGVLAGEAAAPVWSSTTFTNDTLTIKPATQWSVGEGRSLTVNVHDTVGNAINMLSLTYDTGILFVAKTGNDADAGSKSAPLKTISAALAQTGYPEIHVQAGDYDETVTITSGRVIKGSYDINWSSSNLSQTPTHLMGAASGTLVIQDVTASVNVSGLEVDGVNATTPSDSSYALRILNSSGPVHFQTVNIVAGSGANGQNGTAGTSILTAAQNGNPGQNAASYASLCDNTSRGGGGPGAGSGNFAGGGGGAGGTMDTSCGLTPNYNATAGTNGSAAAVYYFTYYGFAGTAGGPCAVGNPGGDGQNGQDGQDGGGGLVGAFSNGLWIPSAGYNGILGTDGTGGGGGGGSGGCDTGTDSYGAGGGGGGAGGARAPTAGTGGGGGGASVGIVIDSSTVDLTDMMITLGNGGTGGNGGAIGYGQPGGGGGSGGQAAGNSLAGGNGGRGGNGGNSGAGGGGAGGSVYGLYESNSVVTTTNVSYTGGTAGTGGAAGSVTGYTGVNGTVVQHN